MKRRKETTSESQRSAVSTMEFSCMPNFLRSTFLEACKFGPIKFSKHVKVTGTFEIKVDDVESFEFSLNDLIVHGQSEDGNRDLCMLTETQIKKEPQNKRRKKDEYAVASIIREENIENIESQTKKGAQKRGEAKKTDPGIIVALPSLTEGFAMFSEAIADFPKQSSFQILDPTSINRSETEVTEKMSTKSIETKAPQETRQVSTRFKGKKHVPIFEDNPGAGSDISKLAMDLNNIVAEADMMLNASDPNKRDAETLTDIVGCCVDIQQKRASYYIPGDSTRTHYEADDPEPDMTTVKNETEAANVIVVKNEDPEADINVLRALDLLADCNEDDEVKVNAVRRDLLRLDSNRSRKTYYLPGESDRAINRDERIRALIDLEINREQLPVPDPEEIRMDIFSCIHCRKVFQSAAMLDNHISSMHPATLCWKCGKMDFSRGQQHHRVCRAPFYCQPCGMFMGQAKVCREEHEDSHYKYTCVICDKYCENQILFSKHMNLCHPAPKKCHVCSITFNSRRELTTHICAGEKNGVFKCPSCDLDLKNKERLLFHKLAAHGPTKGICPICKVILEDNYIMTHYEVHVNPNQNQCGICGNRFKSEMRLRYHLKFVHGRNKPHKCLRCKMHFYTRSCLHRHLISHSAARPINCPLCGSLFKSVGKRNLHLRKCAASHDGNQSRSGKGNKKSRASKANRALIEVQEQAEQKWKPTIFTSSNEYAENTIIIPVEQIEQPCEEATEIIIQNTSDMGQFEEVFGSIPIGQVIEIPPEMCATGDSIENILLHFASQISHHQQINN